VLLLTHLQDLYHKSIKMYPESVNLRIRYAFFLLESSESKDQALHEFNKAEKHQMELDDSFIVYRYSRILQEDMTDSEKKGNNIGLDAVTMVAYNNYYRQCKAQLERAAHLHIEFWAKLNTHIPDVRRLILIGTKISKTIVDIENYWQQMQKINPNNPKAVKMYAEFLKNVLHDEEASNTLLKQISNQNYHKGAEVAIGNFNENDYLLSSYGKAGTPCICVSGDSRNIGIIKNVNSAFCSLVGHCKDGLIDHSLNCILPEILHVPHNKLLQHAAEYKDEVTILGKEQFLPVIMSCGYIKMVMLIVKSLPSFMNEMTFVAIILPKMINETKDVCYLLLDNNKKIADISESIFN